MKKIITLIFILAVTANLYPQNTDVALNQEFLIKELKPLLEKAPIYKKYQKVWAREAKAGEKIITITSDGKETENIAKDGDIIVRNLTKAKEEYILTKAKFQSRYVFLKKIDDTWSLYYPIGEVKAVKVDKNIMKLLNVKGDFYIMAVWGEKMVVKMGDYLVSPLDYNEVYRIANKEFFETYSDDKKSK